MGRSLQGNSHIITDRIGGHLLKVEKRDGRIVEFDQQRIANAIEKSMRETVTGVDEKLSKSIANKIKNEIEAKNEIVSVELIQDLVEEKLMASSRKDVAKAYILYRNNRNLTRDKSSSEYKLLDDEFISQYKHKPSNMQPLGEFVFYRTYSRYLPEEKRREYWWETVRRAVEYNCSIVPTTKQEAQKLFDNVFNLRQFLSGRTLFTGGTEVSKKYGMQNFNCAMTIINDFEAYKDLLYLLLIGAGVGVRVKKSDVEKLPSIRGDIKFISKSYLPVASNKRIEYTSLQYENNTVEIVIGDSKEAWCQALDYFIKFFYLKEFNKVNTIIMNYDNIRPTGEKLKTFGGYSSGYKPFMDMIEKIYKILIKDNNGYKKLKPIDCMDIANIIGIAVISGGVRRTSEVILFDYDDEEIRTSKTNLYKRNEDGEFEIDHEISHRRMSNNTIQYDRKPTREQLHQHMQEMRFSGEPGFQNIIAVKKRKPDADGGNPCMEILLKKNQMCNLTEVNVCGFVEDGALNYEAIYEAQRLSARAGYRMACIEFELHKWNNINKEDMLIGCGLTGWQDMVNATNMTVEEEIDLMKNLKRITDESADKIADEIGANKSKLTTTIKPSGSISQLPVVSSGLHFSHSPYYIRRVRINANDPLVNVVKELGYPIYPEVGQTSDNCDTVVIEFPVKAPIGKTKYDVSAIEQLEIYLRFMKYYVAHNASITVHVRNHEWDEVEQWVWDNWDDIVAVSFLSLDDSFYELMPYESITEEEYNIRKSNMKPFIPSLIQKYEVEETEFDLGQSECVGSVCPIR